MKVEPDPPDQLAACGLCGAKNAVRFMAWHHPTQRYRCIGAPCLGPSRRAAPGCPFCEAYPCACAIPF